MGLQLVYTGKSESVNEILKGRRVWAEMGTFWQLGWLYVYRCGQPTITSRRVFQVMPSVPQPSLPSTHLLQTWSVPFSWPLWCSPGVLLRIWPIGAYNRISKTQTDCT